MPVLFEFRQMESGSKELSEKMAREEEQRRKEAQEMKDRLETEKKQQVFDLILLKKCFHFKHGPLRYCSSAS